MSRRLKDAAARNPGTGRPWCWVPHRLRLLFAGGRLPLLERQRCLAGVAEVVKGIAEGALFRFLDVLAEVRPKAVAMSLSTRAARRHVRL